MFLFDIHCAGTYLGSRAEIDKHHSVRCVGLEEELPLDITDYQIVRVAYGQDYTIARKDIDMVQLAVENKTKAAVLKGNHIFLSDKAIKIIRRELPREIVSQN